MRSRKYSPRRVKNCGTVGDSPRAAWLLHQLSTARISTHLLRAPSLSSPGDDACIENVPRTSCGTSVSDSCDRASSSSQAKRSGSRHGRRHSASSLASSAHSVASLISATISGVMSGETSETHFRMLRLSSSVSVEWPHMRRHSGSCVWHVPAAHSGCIGHALLSPAMVGYRLRHR